MLSKRLINSKWSKETRRVFFYILFHPNLNGYEICEKQYEKFHINRITLSRLEKYGWIKSSKDNTSEYGEQKKYKINFDFLFAIFTLHTNVELKPLSSFEKYLFQKYTNALLLRKYTDKPLTKKDILENPKFDCVIDSIKLWRKTTGKILNLIYNFPDSAIREVQIDEISLEFKKILTVLRKYFKSSDLVNGYNLDAIIPKIERKLKKFSIDDNIVPILISSLNPYSNPFESDKEWDNTMNNIKQEIGKINADIIVLENTLAKKQLNSKYSKDDYKRFEELSIKLPILAKDIQDILRDFREKTKKGDYIGAYKQLDKINEPLGKINKLM